MASVFDFTSFIRNIRRRFVKLTRFEWNIEFCGRQYFRIEGYRLGLRSFIIILFAPCAKITLLLDGSRHAVGSTQSRV